MWIKQAEPEDAGLLARLDRCCFSDDWDQKDWKDFLLMDQYHCYIIEDDTASKGFLLISTAADEGEVLKIGVLPDSRGHDLGMLLLKKAFAEWKISGVKHIFLEVRESNQSAQRLYKKLGFEKAGIRRNYYKNPKEHAIIYIRNI